MDETDFVGNKPQTSSADSSDNQDDLIATPPGLAAPKGGDTPLCSGIARDTACSTDNPRAPGFAGDTPCHSLREPRLTSTCFMENPMDGTDTSRNSTGFLRRPRLSTHPMESPHSSACPVASLRNLPSFKKSPRPTACFWDELLTRPHAPDSPRNSACSMDSPLNSAYSVDSPRNSACFVDSRRDSAYFMDSPRNSACFMDSPRNSACSMDSPRDSPMDIPPDKVGSPRNSAYCIDSPRNSACFVKGPRLSATSSDSPRSSVCSMDSPRNSAYLADSPRNSACSPDIPRNPTCFTDSPRNSAYFIESPCQASCSPDLCSPRNSACSIDSPRNSACSVDSPRYSACFFDSPRHSACSPDLICSPRDSACSPDLICSPRDSACSIDSPRNSACSVDSRRHSAHLMDWESEYESLNSPSNRTFPAPVAMKIWFCRDVILRDLRAEDVIDHLIQDEVLNTEDVENIMHATTTKGKAKKLLEFVILQKDRKGCDSLLCALCLVYPHLADAVQNADSMGEEQEFMFKKWIYERSYNLARTIGIQPHGKPMPQHSFLLLLSFWHFSPIHLLFSYSS